METKNTYNILLSLFLCMSSLAYAEEKKEIAPLDESKYKDLNDPEVRKEFTPLYLSLRQQSERPLSEDKVAALVSKEYREEQDHFKKKDMLKELIPQIKKSYDAYEGKTFYLKSDISFTEKSKKYDEEYRQKMRFEPRRPVVTLAKVGDPIFNYEKLEVELKNCSSKGFDFSSYFYDSRNVYFPINYDRVELIFKHLPPIGATQNGKVIQRTNSEKDYSWTRNSKNTSCAFKMEESVARKISAAEASYKLSTKGTVYYRSLNLNIQSNDYQHRINLLPVKAEIVFYHADTDEELLKHQLKF